MSLAELKNFDAKRASLEEMVDISAQARILQTEFVTLGIDTPEWVDIAVVSLRREIASRTSDARAAKLRELKSRRAQLLTPDEKRKALDAEIDALEAQGV